jgi:hypothetical protein
MASARSIWRVVYDQGYGRPQTVDEYTMEAHAFDAALSKTRKANSTMKRR